MGIKFSKKTLMNKDKQETYLIQTCEEHESSINCMEISDDKSVIVTGSDDTNIRLWSTQTEMIECIGLLEGHKDYITSIFIEGNFVFSSSADKTIRKWDMSTCECVLIFRGHDSTVNKIVCGSSNYLFSVAYDKKAKSWNSYTGECLNTFEGHERNVPMLLFVPSKPGQYKKQINGKNEDRKTIASKLKTHLDEEEALEEDLIITGSYDSTAKSWSIQNGKCIHTFKGHTGAITCITTDFTNKLLFTGSADHSIRSWEIATGNSLKVFEGHSSTIIAISTEKKILYSAGSDHTARCWVMEFGDCTRVYKEHDHGVHQIFENKGLIYTACGDGIARCFDAKSASLKRIFKGHTGAVNVIKIIDDRLFTGSYDGTLRVWDATGLIPEKQTGQNREPKPRIKKHVDDDDLTFSVKNQRMVIENEEPPSPKIKNSNKENEDHEFFRQYARQRMQGFNTRMSEFDEP